MTAPRRVHRMHRIVGWLLAIATVICVVENQRDVGIARDETFYMSAGTAYIDWWVGLVKLQHGADARSITQTFGGAYGGPGNPEHPPLVKTLSGLSHRLLHDDLHVFDELTAYRFPSAVLHGVLVLLVYTMTLELWGFAEAVLAALCLLLLPRALFHAGLACFDAPIACTWFATIYAYWRCLDKRRWPWQVGVAWGLALATKHTALFLPFALGLHYAIVVVPWRGRRYVPGSRIVAFARDLVRHPVIPSLALLGPLVLIALWPWLWLDPSGHIHGWLAFHLNHVNYNYEYLGHNWNAPRFPWHVAPLTTLFTVPIATLASAAVGMGVWISRWWWRESADRARAPALLLVLSAGASIGPFLLGTTPIFGAEKHWMPILPTLAIAAGVGGVWAARRAAVLLRARHAERIAIAIVGGAIVLAAAVETRAGEPYALTWYDALAGGAPGGADLGMNRQYWGVAARGVLPVIAQQPPAPVYTHDASLAWPWYQRFGEVSADHPDAGGELAGIVHSRLAIVVHEKHFNRHDYMIWNAYGTVQPIFVLRSNGVPIVSLYKRP